MVETPTNPTWGSSEGLFRRKVIIIGTESLVSVCLH